jgi:hypothetical protein
MASVKKAKPKKAKPKKAKPKKAKPKKAKPKKAKPKKKAHASGWKRLTLDQCERVVTIRKKYEPAKAFQVLKAIKATGTVADYPGPWYVERLAVRCSARLAKSD